MNKNIEETIKDDSEELQSISWQRRGYTLLNSCVTAISMETGKVVDVKATSCRTFNYKGSTGSMEIAGAKRIFERSITKRNLRYAKLLFNVFIISKHRLGIDL